MKKTEPKKKASSISSKPKKKVVKKVKKAGVEGEEYWANRPVDDSRLDWRNGAGSWIEEYVASTDHPHRELIVNALKAVYPFAGILEVGCNAGPNLIRLSDAFPETQLAGVDTNASAILKAREVLPGAIFKVGSLTHLPFGDQEFDVGLADAVFLYADPNSTRQAAEELKRVIRKYLVLVEWHDESKEGVVKDFHWTRNYPALFEEYGFSLVEDKPLSKADWPNEKWATHGHIYVLVRQSPTSATN